MSTQAKSFSRARRVPPSLAKRGITGVVDNSEGRELHVPQGLISRFFEGELRAFVSKKKAEREALNQQAAQKS